MCVQCKEKSVTPNASRCVRGCENACTVRTTTGIHTHTYRMAREGEMKAKRVFGTAVAAPFHHHAFLSGCMQCTVRRQPVYANRDNARPWPYLKERQPAFMPQPPHAAWCVQKRGKRGQVFQHVVMQVQQNAVCVFTCVRAGKKCVGKQLTAG